MQEIIGELLAIFAVHGLSESIVCDNGPQFRSEFEKFAKQHDIVIIISSSYLPRSNGQAEYALKTIKRIFTKCTMSEQMLLLEHNNTPSEGFD